MEIGLRKRIHLECHFKICEVVEYINREFIFYKFSVLFYAKMSILPFDESIYCKKLNYRDI